MPVALLFIMGDPLSHCILLTLSFHLFDLIEPRISNLGTIFYHNSINNF